MLINSPGKMRCEADGAQELRHIVKIGKFLSTAQRSKSLAQTINQRCHNKGSKGRQFCPAVVFPGATINTHNLPNNFLTAPDNYAQSPFIRQHRRQPALGFFDCPAFALRIVFDLILADLADRKKRRFRVREVKTGDRGGWYHRK